MNAAFRRNGAEKGQTRVLSISFGKIGCFTQGFTVARCTLVNGYQALRSNL